MRWSAWTSILMIAATTVASEAQQVPPTDPDAEVRVAADEDLWPAEGAAAKATTFAYPLNANVYETLIVLGSDYVLRPGLAERWELIPPGTWRFHLRRGVKFHNDQPFTADDVVWSWGERQMEGKSLSTVANTLGPGSIKKVDDFTVDFTPRVPNLRLPEQILHPSGSIVQRGRHFDSTPPAGTGPFKVVTYRPGERAVVERFDGYWGPKPRVKRLVFRFLPDPQTRMEALKAGEVDFLMDAPADAVASIERDARFRVVRARPGRNQLIYVNKTGKGPNDLGADRAIRQAVSLAIDRKVYVDAVFEGNAEPGRWMAPAFVLGKFAESVPPPRYDPAAARRLLDEAGWRPGADGVRIKDGRRLALELIGWAEVSPAAFQVIQAQLRDIGIDVTIKKAPDRPTYLNLYRNTQFDLDLEVPNQNDGNPAFLPVLRMYTKSTGTERFAPGGRFDEWAERALAATSTDDVRRASAEMMQILIHQEFIVIPLAGVYRIYAMKRNVSFTDPHPSQTNQSWLSLGLSR
jgi:peptide/nickel transport system substrate-binding protein